MTGIRMMERQFRANHAEFDAHAIRLLRISAIKATLGHSRGESNGERKPESFVHENNAHGRIHPEISCRIAVKDSRSRFLQQF